MSVTDLLGQSAQLMVLGMLSVFVFLFVLIGCISLLSRLIGKLQPVEAPAAPAQVSESVPANLMSDPELVSVITSAIHNYRAQKKRD